MAGGNDLGGGSNESDLRVSAAANESYMTPAHYSGYEEASDYHSLSQDHQTPHPYNLDGSPEFYSASGIHLETKYQPPPFKNYSRGESDHRSSIIDRISISICSFRTFAMLKFVVFSIVSSGRYHEGYSEAGYAQYDTSNFQTVPGSGNGGVGDQWSVGPLGEHLSHHPAFLAGLGPRDPSNPHHTSSIGNNHDQKPLLQSAMLAGYTGESVFLFVFSFSYRFSIKRIAIFV